MPPLRMNRSVQSTDHSNDNRTTITVTETSTKTFLIIIFRSETCCKPTLVTRYFSGKVSCHAIELFIDYEHRYLTTCKLDSCSLTWLNGTVLLLNTEEDLYIRERSEDSAKNTTEIFIFSVRLVWFGNLHWALTNSGDMVDSSLTIETKCIVWHQTFERQAQRTVLQALILWLSCIQFCA